MAERGSPAPAGLRAARRVSATVWTWAVPTLLDFPTNMRHEGILFLLLAGGALRGRGGALLQ